MVSPSPSSFPQERLVRIAEPVWRAAASQHARRIRGLLQPGLTKPRHRLSDNHEWTALDPKHPVYNFLIEYYGLKGVKGPKRLARWSPSPALLLTEHSQNEKNYSISSLKKLESLSSYTTTTTSTAPQSRRRRNTEKKMKRQYLLGGILLEGAGEGDLGATLHLRGSMPYRNDQGIYYSPSAWSGRPSRSCKKAASYLWYRSILRQTLSAEPILHCHGMHEWALQYRPAGAPPPPSAKYQSHLALRVSQDTINRAVERRGVSCTHVDALRYFAPAAGPLNHYGDRHSLQRSDQLRLEQPACVHAQMDLLKIVLRLQPFVDASLVQRVLDLALQARRLDVAASPYDASLYGVGVVAVESKEGREEYRQEQTRLMELAKPIRRDLLRAYNVFLDMAFEEEEEDSLLAGEARRESAEPIRQNLLVSELPQHELPPL